MKTKIKIIILVVLALLVAVGIGFLIYLNLPQNVAIRAVAGAIEDVFERDEIEPLFNVLEKGSLEASVNQLECKDEDWDLLDGAKLSGKVYFSKNALMLENLTLKHPSLNLSGDIYLSDKMVYISEDKVMKGSYGGSFEELAEALKDSIFSPDSDSKYSISDEDLFDRIVETLEGESDSADFRKDAEALVKGVVKDAWGIACDNFEFESESEKVQLNTGKKTARVIRITITGKSMAGAIAEFYAYLENSDEIQSFLEKHGKGADELYEDFLADFDDEIDELCEEIEDDMEDIVIKVVTPRLSHKLLQLSVEYDGEEIFLLDLGEKGIKKTDSITLEAGYIKASYEIKQNDKKAYAGTLKLEDGYSDIEFELAIDRKSETYEFSFEEAYEYSNKYYEYESNWSIQAKGDFIQDGKKTTITLEKITEKDQRKYDYYEYWYDDSEYSYEDIFDCDIKVVLSQKDKMPKAPKDYDSLSEIKEKDVDKWLEGLDKFYNIWWSWF